MVPTSAETKAGDPEISDNLVEPLLLRALTSFCNSLISDSIRKSTASILELILDSICLESFRNSSTACKISLSFSVLDDLFDDLDDGKPFELLERSFESGI